MTDVVPGHVFVVHGRLEDVACDAIVIPTDDTFTIETHWEGIHEGLLDVTKPEDWESRHFGKSQDDPTRRRLLWFVDVTDAGEPSLEAITHNLTALLHAISMTPSDRARVVRGRPKRLVALPLLGTGLGGHDSDVGTVIRSVLDTLESAACSSGLDIALVIPGRAAVAATQLGRRQRIATGSEDVHQCRIAEHAKQGNLSLLIGAGVSMGAGLPSWSGLLSSLWEDVPDEHAHLRTNGLSPLDEAQLLADLAPDFTQALVERIRNATKRPALGHLLLASLGCRQVATTNYDLLYEEAVASQQGKCEAGTRHRAVPAVLPFEPPKPGGAWILKLHGDIDHPSNIVLTRSQFVSYDAHQGPGGALFQGMLLTSHVLVVGTSFTDDNVLRLLFEVADYADPASDGFGTVLSLGPDEARSRLWEKELTWIGVEATGVRTDGLDTQNAADDVLRWRARELEIFLDGVAMYAASDEDVYLDSRFDGLLSDGQRAAAEHRRNWEKCRSTGPASDESRQTSMPKMS